MMAPKLLTHEYDAEIYCDPNVGNVNGSYEGDFLRDPASVFL